MLLWSCVPIEPFRSIMSQGAAVAGARRMNEVFVTAKPTSGMQTLFEAVLYSWPSMANGGSDVKWCTI